ncbi:hypothetical protein AB2B41_22955, partial [Marimonas sp. MJW-29]
PSSFVDHRRPTLAHRCRRGAVTSSKPGSGIRHFSWGLGKEYEMCFRACSLAVDGRARTGGSEIHADIFQIGEVLDRSIKAAFSGKESEGASFQIELTFDLTTPRISAAVFQRGEDKTMSPLHCSDRDEKEIVRLARVIEKYYRSTISSVSSELDVLVTKASENANTLASEFGL